MSFSRWVALSFALAAFFAGVRLARAAEPAGLAVVATAGATDAAWPLAGAIYGDAALRPKGLDDATARVLAGETAPAGATSDVQALAELRAGVHGDDAASRELLAAIAQRLAVRGVVVVFAGTPPTARVYDVASKAFDAARYVPDVGARLAWSSAVRSLARPYAAAPPSSPSAQPVALAPVAPAKKGESKSFWGSPWFWVAVGAAVLAGGAVLIATNVRSGDNIHLQMTLP